MHVIQINSKNPKIYKMEQEHRSIEFLFHWNVFPNPNFGKLTKNSLVRFKFNLSYISLLNKILKLHEKVMGKPLLKIYQYLVFLYLNYQISIR